ncbi:MAG: MFS transporter [Actinomycetota bacterium]
MSDVRRILLLRAARAFAYGFTSVLLGIHLADVMSPARAGLILTATLAGSAALTAVLGARGHRIGRRRAHVFLSIAMAAAMSSFALTTVFPILLIAALTGTVAVATLEAGPLAALEQAMLPHVVPAERRNRWFGRYTAVAAILGSFGALAAGGPDAIRRVLSGAPETQRWFLLPAAIALACALIAMGLSRDVEAPTGQPSPLRRSRGVVARLSALFALDGLGGGFVVPALVAYWFRIEHGTSAETLGLVFFGVGILQSISFLVAARLADRFGLVNTMVFTHLPSNLLLAAIPLMPNEGSAIAVLLARHALSQMDVPARQSYVVAVVDDEERTAAAMFTNTSRSVAQAVSPSVSGPAMTAAGAGVPFFIGAGLKIVYDILLYRSFRGVRTPEEATG